MPKAKNPLSPAEQRKRFEEEVKKLKEAGNFDPDAADAALDKLIRQPENQGEEGKRRPR